MRTRGNAEKPDGTLTQGTSDAVLGARLVIVLEPLLFAECLARRLQDVGAHVLGWYSNLDDVAVDILDEPAVLVTDASTLQHAPYVLDKCACIAVGAATGTIRGDVPWLLSGGLDSLIDLVRGAWLKLCPASAIVSRVESLTSRQVEILQLVANGHTTAEVGRRVGVTAKTVNNHLGTVYRRLAVRNLTQAVLVASRRGLIRLP